MATQQMRLNKVDQVLQRMRQRRAKQLIREIKRLQKEITRQTGEWDSVEVIRAIREGRARP